MSDLHTPTLKSVQAKHKLFARNKWRWLDQVVVDDDLPPSAFKVAYVIANHINRGSGDAWPSTSRIAKCIGMSKGTVVEMARRLENHGHIAVERGSQGRGHSHHYRMNLKPQPTDQLQVRKAQSADLYVRRAKGQFRATKGQASDLKGQHADMNLTKNHEDEPRGRARRALSPTSELRKHGASSDATMLTVSDADPDDEWPFEDTELGDDDDIPF